MSILDIPLVDEETSAGGTEPPAEETGWQRNKAGKEYVKAVGRRGVIMRQGDETVAQAIERDSQPKAQGRPQRKAPKAPPPPKHVDLKALEEQLAEGLKSPALAAAMMGDQWAADHFTNMGPYLARNLVLASETNPWLRRKLENAATGGDMMMQLMAMAGLGSAIVLYLVPPVVYWLNVPFPDKGREMLGIPERQTDGSPDYPAGA